MKLSHLIKRLALELELRGDLSVCYENEDGDGYYDVKEIGVFHCVGTSQSLVVIR